MKSRVSPIVILTLILFTANWITGRTAGTGLPEWVTPLSSAKTVNLADIKGAPAATMKAGDLARVLGGDETHYKVQFGGSSDLFVLKALVSPAAEPDDGKSKKGSSHLARNWGWYAGGLALAGGGAAAAGGGGGSDSASGEETNTGNLTTSGEKSSSSSGIEGTYAGRADFGDRVNAITIRVSGSSVHIADGVSPSGSSGPLQGTSFSASANWSDATGAKSLRWSGNIRGRVCSGSCTAVGDSFTSSGTFSASKK